MYEIRPETAKSFVTDRSIHLPRFQRKQTWDYLKNFLLCISVFKGYPLGVCIINKENSGTSSKKVLLDGRQRRNALTQMFENPDIIGLWAKKFLKVSQSIDSMELEGVFDESIEKYLESDEDDIAFQSESSTEDDTGAVDWENENEETSVKESSDGIGLLRQIVALTYKRLKHYTSFTAPFDFSKLIANLPFCDSDENNAYVINGKKVKSFFIEYQRHCEDNNIEYDENSEYFADYLISRGSLKDGITKDKVKNVVQKKWAEILVRFVYLKRWILL